MTMADPMRSVKPGGMQLERTRLLTERVRMTAAPIVQALGLDLVEVICCGQGPRTLVRVFIDKPGGVRVSDCEQLHRSLGHALVVEDPLPHSYTLEVSSPGLDRPFKDHEDYRRSIGRLVNLKLRRPSNGEWRVVGRLTETDEQGVTVEVRRSNRGQPIRLDWEAIAEGRLEVEF
ncbi:MAG: ribosome maturation factor RimP [Nitrospiraceae bacterium]